MRLLAVLVGLLVAGTLGGAPAHAAASFQAPATRDAQDPPAAPNRGNRPDPSDPLAPVSTGELVNMLDTYAIVRAQAELTLNDAQYAQFVTRLKRLQEARRRNQRERNQILQDLRRLTGPLAPAPADETVVRERLESSPRPRRASYRRDAEGLRNAGRSPGRASAGALPDLRGDNRAPEAGSRAPGSRAGEPVRAWRSVAGQCSVLTRQWRPAAIARRGRQAPF